MTARATMPVRDRIWKAIRIMRVVDAPTVALAVCASQRTTRAYLRWLELRGFLTCILRSQRRIGSHSRYRLTRDPGPRAPHSVDKRPPRRPRKTGIASRLQHRCNPRALAELRVRRELVRSGGATLAQLCSVARVRAFTIRDYLGQLVAGGLLVTIATDAWTVSNAQGLRA